MGNKDADGSNSGSALAFNPTAKNLGAAALYLGIFALGLPVSPQVFVVFIALAAGLLLFANAGQAGSIDRRVLLAASVFIGVSAVSAGLAIEPRRALLMTVSLLPVGLMGYLIATRLSDRMLEFLPWVLALTAGVVSIYLLSIVGLHPGAGPQDWMDAADCSQFSVPNDLLFLAIVAPFVLALIIRPGPVVFRLVACAVLLAMSLVLLLFQSRTGFIILLLAVFAALLNRRTLKWLPLLALAGLLVLLADWLNGFQMSTKFMHLGTVTARLPLWLSAWEMFLDAPVWGHGPGAYSVLYEAYVSRLDIPEWVVLDFRHIPWPHNLYLELLAERGGMGLLALMAILFVIFIRYKRMFSLEDVDFWLFNALVNSFILLLVASCIDLSFLRLWFVVVFFIHLGVLSRLPPEAQDS